MTSPERNGGRTASCFRTLGAEEFLGAGLDDAFLALFGRWLEPDENKLERERDEASLKEGRDEASLKEGRDKERLKERRDEAWLKEHDKARLKERRNEERLKEGRDEDCFDVNSNLPKGDTGDKLAAALPDLPSDGSTDDEGDDVIKPGFGVGRFLRSLVIGPPLDELVIGSVCSFKDLISCSNQKRHTEGPPKEAESSAEKAWPGRKEACLADEEKERQPIELAMQRMRIDRTTTQCARAIDAWLERQTAQLRDAADHVSETWPIGVDVKPEESSIEELPSPIRYVKRADGKSVGCSATHSKAGSPLVNLTSKTSLGEMDRAISHQVAVISALNPTARGAARGDAGTLVTWLKMQYLTLARDIVSAQDCLDGDDAQGGVRYDALRRRQEALAGLEDILRRRKQLTEKISARIYRKAERCVPKAVLQGRQGGQGGQGGQVEAKRADASCQGNARRNANEVGAGAKSRVESKVSTKAQESQLGRDRGDSSEKASTAQHRRPNAHGFGNSRSASSVGLKSTTKPRVRPTVFRAEFKRNRVGSPPERMEALTGGTGHGRNLKTPPDNPKPVAPSGVEQKRALGRNTKGGDPAGGRRSSAVRTNDSVRPTTSSPSNALRLPRDLRCHGKQRVVDEQADAAHAGMAVHAGMAARRRRGHRASLVGQTSDVQLLEGRTDLKLTPGWGDCRDEASRCFLGERSRRQPSHVTWGRGQRSARRMPRSSWTSTTAVKRADLRSPTSTAAPVVAMETEPVRSNVLLDTAHACRHRLAQIISSFRLGAKGGLHMRTAGGVERKAASSSRRFQYNHN